MIEQIMYFTLGVLIATLVALLVLPAVWHRAVRLTTKRVEAAVPISIFEVQADKDQQRAFFALNQRRLELQTDAMRDTIVAHAATIETQRQRIFDLEAAMGALEARHGLLSGTSAERDVLLGEVQDQLSDRTAALASTEETLAARTAALAALEQAHAALEAQARDLVATLATRETTLVTERARITAMESEATTLGTTLSGTAQRLDETAATLDAERAAAAEARLAAAEAATRLNAEIAEVRAALSAATQESTTRGEAIAALEGERDRLAADLATALRDLDASRAVVHAFEQRRATEFATAEAESRRLADALHMLRADHALMEDTVRRGRDTASAPAGDDVLRATMGDLAARLAALTARLEGEASPIPALVAGESGGLAGRIRSLLAADEAPGEAGDSAEETPQPEKARAAG